MRTTQRFKQVYDAPQVVKQGVASGALNPGPGLGQARAARRSLAQNILTQPGARQGLFDAYGKGFHPGDLHAALRTIHSAHEQVATGAQPPTLLDSPMYQRASQTANRLLGIRRDYLQRKYLAG